jgi:hypothetical protein
MLSEQKKSMSPPSENYGGNLWNFTIIAAKNQVAYSFWNKQGFKVYRHTLYSEI